MQTRDIINSLLANRYVDTDTNANTTLPVRSIVIDEGVVNNIEDLVAKSDIGGNLLLVADSNTWEVAGKGVVANLARQYRVKNLVFEESPECKTDEAQQIIESGKDIGAIVAVGSGTINDLCKYASHKLNIPYVIVATAPSMNGYCSCTSSIKLGSIKPDPTTLDKFKSSVKTKPPVGVFMDLGIMTNAPLQLVKAGFGDLICRSTAQTDWLLSHLLLGTYYNNTPFELTRSLEEGLLENTELLLRRDKEAIAELCYGLVLSGIGMLIAGGSHPASQGEHMIAHYMEMMCSASEVSAKKHIHNPAQEFSTTFHGEQIGVTTITMSKLQHKIIQHKIIQSPSAHFVYKPVPEKEIIQHFGETLGKKCIDETSQKWLSPEIIERLNDEWELIKDKLLIAMVNTESIEKGLNAINAPTTSRSLGWADKTYTDAIKYARFLRNRFTFLDLKYYLTP